MVLGRAWTMFQEWLGFRAEKAPTPEPPSTNKDFERAADQLREAQADRSNKTFDAATKTFGGNPPGM
jgi:hypothetical protein